MQDSDPLRIGDLVRLPDGRRLTVMRARRRPDGSRQVSLSAKGKPGTWYTEPVRCVVVRSEA